MFSRNVKNAIFNALGETVWGFQANMVIAATVLTVLLLSYGASERTIGAIAAIETGGTLLPQFLGAYVFTSRKHLKRDLIVWHLVFLCSLLLVMGGITWFADTLSPAVYRGLMLGTFVCSSLALGVVVAVWVDWLAKIFGIGIRGTVIGVSMACAAFAGTGGALVAGWIVGHLPSPLSYACLYLAAGGIAGLAMLLFALIDDPAVREEDSSIRPRFSAMVAMFRESLADKNFRAYLVGRILASCGFAILPFIAVHYASARGGSLGAGVIVSCGSALTLGMAVGSALLGRLGDRRGHRMGVLIGVAVQVLSLVILILVPGLWGCIIAYFGSGLCALGTWVSHFNIIIETCPHEHRVAHISVGNLVLGVATCLLPLVAGFIAGRWGTVILFAISAGFSAIAFLWFLLKVREPREC